MIRKDKSVRKSNIEINVNVFYLNFTSILMNEAESERARVRERERERERDSENKKSEFQIGRQKDNENERIKLVNRRLRVGNGTRG